MGVHTLTDPFLKCKRALPVATHCFSAPLYLQETATFTAEAELKKEIWQEAKGSSSQARAVFGKAEPQLVLQPGSLSSKVPTWAMSTHRHLGCGQWGASDSVQI